MILRVSKQKHACKLSTTGWTSLQVVHRRAVQPLLPQSLVGWAHGSEHASHLKSMGVKNVATRRSHLCMLPLSSTTTVLAG